MANSLNLNFADYFILRNLSMIAYIIEIEKSKFINLSFHEIEQSEPGRKIKFCVYFHPAGMSPYASICNHKNILLFKFLFETLVSINISRPIRAYLTCE